MFRFNRLIWIFGILLLIGTVAGAGWMLNRSHASSSDASKDSKVTVPYGGKGIAAGGHVDVEPGISRLYPSQLGRVVWIVEEGKKVKKGDVLLQVDDRQAQAKLREAKLALAQAKVVLKEAKIAVAMANIAYEEAKVYPKKHEAEIKGQQAILEAAEKQKESGKIKLKDALKFFDEGYLKLNEKNQAVDLFKKIAAIATAQREKLKALKLENPQLKVQLAEKTVELKKQKVEEAQKDVEYKEELVKQAQIAVDQHQVHAPAGGMALRVHTRVGEVLGNNPKAPAIEFCPDLPKIVRTEVLQEWANSVKEGQECIIEDDTSSAYQWHGKIIRVSKWLTHRRSIIQEPFRFNDVRTLECIVSIQETPGHPLRIGQRMRVMIKQGGP